MTIPSYPRDLRATIYLLLDMASRDKRIRLFLVLPNEANCFRSIMRPQSYLCSLRVGKIAHAVLIEEIAEIANRI
jgi:hypothetical protein